MLGFVSSAFWFHGGAACRALKNMAYGLDNTTLVVNGGVVPLVKHVLEAHMNRGDAVEAGEWGTFRAYVASGCGL